ncbi:Ni/Co efflux regulator RcnB [Pseudorhizobium tarimense]|uniref:Lectin-like protein BA14k n=1 Tax=Pseudorhizobium tarimense TaxID=1079109 RepID=A0ABV2HE99_9HYPH|nr:BA14K family protein [Pseudorhizobium tarimense]MCJ8521837.1 BA14K family protein [Pseudorhizobium tarimense]
MFGIAKTLTAGAMSALLLATSIAPAGAVVLPSVKAPQASSAVELVQYRDRDRRFDRDDRRRWDRDRGDRRGYYRGHRGSREYRRGYRRHNDGWWYPLAAFGAGAIIGGAITNQPRPAQALPTRHVQWCSDRYRTYRASDNTYVPRVGVRAYCNSPYSR